MNYQHSAIRGEALTLPSVEGGFGTMNILRDPPKAIHTRYKPKVSDTSQITQMIGASDDRICESIKKYARGVDPFGGGSYNNYGTNGGQNRDMSGSVGTGQVTSNTQAYYPRTIIKDGTFRPPIRAPESLLPLSRLPRLSTTSQTNPGSERTIKLTRCNTDLKSLRRDLLRVCAIPKATFNIERPSTKPHEVNNIIADKIKAVAIPNKSSSNTQYVLGVNQKPRYGVKTQENTLYGSVPSSIYKNINVKPLHTFLGNQSMPIQDRVKGNVSTNVNGTEHTKYIHKQQNFKRNCPLTSMMINPSHKGVDINNTIRKTDYKLPSRLSLGSFTNNGFKPSAERTDVPVNVGADRSHQMYIQKQLSVRK